MDFSNYREELERRHRDAMLDVILAYAKIDVALCYMVSSVFGFTPLEGTELVARRPASMKFEEVRRLFQERDPNDMTAKLLRRMRKNYKSAVNVRNRITHARCHGVSMEDSDYIIFSPFERYNDDSMMIEAIPLDRMVGTALWGDRVAEALMRLGKQATDLHARLGSASALQSKHR